ncbi:MAG: DeoR/GlpR family DNA-binding transcription regulator [Lachnospiraceae bacterium]|nr:DeoR/GlpR family DNA-binding transcription regulator [Lachnospiraceae bacterium]
MLPIKRLEEIKQVLTEKKQADVPSLAQLLDVTEATIRRDLEKLENEQFLTRTHGGAVLNEPAHANISLFQLPEEHNEIFQNIGQIAAQFVQNNDVIFLGPGISSRFIVRQLQNKINVTLITTDLMVAHDCSAYSPNISVILTGGSLNPTTLELSGQMTTNSLNNFYFNTSFFDIDGITFNRGYSVSSLNKAFLIQNVNQISQKSFALCPYNRFGRESSAVVGDINLFQSVITNEHLEDSFKEYYFQQKIQVFATFNV